MTRARRQRWRMALGGAGLALCAAGCTVGPDFAPPHADVPPHWHDLRNEPASASVPA